MPGVLGDVDELDRRAAISALTVGRPHRGRRLRRSSAWPSPVLQPARHEQQERQPRVWQLQSIDATVIRRSPGAVQPATRSVWFGVDAAAAVGSRPVDPRAPGRWSEWITIDWAFWSAAGSFLRASANARPSAVSSGLSRSCKRLWVTSRARASARRTSRGRSPRPRPGRGSRPPRGAARAATGTGRGPSTNRAISRASRSACARRFGDGALRSAADGRQLRAESSAIDGSAASLAAGVGSRGAAGFSPQAGSP